MGGSCNLDRRGDSLCPFRYRVRPNGPFRSNTVSPAHCSISNTSVKNSTGRTAQAVTVRMDRVPNTTVLERSGSLSLHLLLCQRRLRWLGHVYRMEDGRIPKDILYGELVTGRCPVGRPALRFRDVCKRDMKCADIDPASWEQLAADRSEWRHAVKVGLARGQVKHHMQLETKRQKRKEKLHAQNSSSFLCPNCGSTGVTSDIRVAGVWSTVFAGKAEENNSYIAPGRECKTQVTEFQNPVYAPAVSSAAENPVYALAVSPSAEFQTGSCDSILRSKTDGCGNSSARAAATETRRTVAVTVGDDNIEPDPPDELQADNCNDIQEDDDEDNSARAAAADREQTTDVYEDVDGENIEPYAKCQDDSTKNTKRNAPTSHEKGNNVKKQKTTCEGCSTEGVFGVDERFVFNKALVSLAGGRVRDITRTKDILSPCDESFLPGQTSICSETCIESTGPSRRSPRREGLRIHPYEAAERNLGQRADYTWRARIPGRSGREVSASGRLSDVYAYFDLSTAVGHSEPKEGLLRVMGEIVRQKQWIKFAAVTAANLVSSTIIILAIVYTSYTVCLQDSDTESNPGTTWQTGLSFIDNVITLSPSLGWKSTAPNENVTATESLSRKTENQTDSDKPLKPDNLDGQPLQTDPTPPAFSKRFIDCSEIHTALKEYGAVSNGVHKIMPKGLTSPISVYCDQITDGGGWTVIQRRFNGSIDFNRPYNDFKYGFGSANGEQWLGLGNVYRLTKQKGYELYIVLEDWVGTVKYAKYSSFSLRGSNYRISVGGYSGTAGDGFYLARSPYSGAGQNRQPFSARDVDRDRWDKGSCAAGRPYTAGGWWYNGCGLSVLNGPYIRPSDRTNHSGWGIAWGPFGGPDTYHLKKTKMMVRPANFRQ
ncbi:hypothetical protein Bbelb_065700 [Branchiostoma belcheri]|nr:hypothetical protein Bbelb_065700 [Branchiostoma belcheri]